MHGNVTPHTTRRVGALRRFTDVLSALFHGAVASCRADCQIEEVETVLGSAWCGVEHEHHHVLGRLTRDADLPSVDFERGEDRAKPRALDRLLELKVLTHAAPIEERHQRMV